MIPSVLGSIPSPPFNALHIGSFQLRLYGLMIACGAWAGVALSRKRWMDRGGASPDIGTIAMWAIPAGLVGARLYHVMTDWNDKYADHPLNAFKIWQGGLGIPGGIVLGTLAGVWVVKRHGWPLATLMDVVAPALPLAQAIGRLGNWFNQELYGRPTDLPWAIRIDAAHRPTNLLGVATYHPTFLYEMLWNLALVGLLIWVDKKRVLAAGNLFWLYVVGYSLGRLWVEDLRIDYASRLFGLRVNEWVSGLGIVVGLTIIVIRQRRVPPDPLIVVGPDAEGAAAEAATTADEVASDG